MADESADLERGLAAAFADEARRGVQLAVFGRAIAFALFWLTFYVNAHGHFDNPLLLYRTALLGVALAGALGNFLVARRTRRPVEWSYPFIVLDFVVAAGLVFGWLPEIIADYPQHLAVRFQDVLFFTVVVAFSVLPLSRRLPLFAVAVAAAAWLVGLAQAFWRMPGGTTDWRIERGALPWPDLLAAISRPRVLNLDYVVLQVAALAALGVLLAAGVDQARRLVERSVRAERDRDRLARFFPPALAARLAAGGGRLAGERREVAVLFVDFDRARDVQLGPLGDWYAACEQVIFAHGGVIERFAGDPVMAAFGALPDETRPADGAADAAWRCATALRERLGGASLGLGGVGLAFGPALAGEVGSARQRAFAVVGETTNLASRLLEVGRARGGALALSDAFRARLSGPPANGLQDLGPCEVRGFAAPVRVWAA